MPQFVPAQQQQQQQQPAQQQNQDFPDANGGNERERDTIFLFIKLAFLVYLLGQGGSVFKLVFLSIGAVLIFL